MNGVSLQSYIMFWPGVLALVVLSIVGAWLGIFLSLRRMSLAGDAISHSLLPGIALAYGLKGFDMGWLTVGAFLSGTLAITIVVFLNHRKKNTSDAHMALLYLTFLSLGILILTSRPTQIDILDLLFGNLLALETPTLFWMIPLCILLSGLTFLRARALWITSTDHEWAQFLGFSLAKNEFLFLFALNLCLVLSFQVAGTLLSLGLLLFPAMTVRQWSTHLTDLFVGGIAIAIFNALVGVFVSFYLNAPAGPSIVMVSATVYLFNFSFAWIRGHQ